MEGRTSGNLEAISLSCIHNPALQHFSFSNRCPSACQSCQIGAHVCTRSCARICFYRQGSGLFTNWLSDHLCLCGWSHLSRWLVKYQRSPRGMMGRATKITSMLQKKKKNLPLMALLAAAIVWRTATAIVQLIGTYRGLKLTANVKKLRLSAAKLGHLSLMQGQIKLTAIPPCLAQVDVYIFCL